MKNMKLEHSISNYPEVTVLPFFMVFFVGFASAQNVVITFSSFLKSIVRGCRMHVEVVSPRWPDVNGPYRKITEVRC